MAAMRDTAAAIRFRGFPPSLTAVAELPAPTPNWATVDIDLPQKTTSRGRSLAQVASSGGRMSVVRLGIPMGTPPGTYAGNISIAGGTRSAVFEVGSRIQLRVVPDTVRLETNAGDQIDITLTIVAVGNAPWELRPVEGLGLYKVDGVERAIGQAFIAELKRGERRIDRLAEELRAGHGGIMRVAIQDGAGTIGPGEARTVRARLHVPPRLRPGQRYLATWPFHDAQCRIELSVRSARAGGKRRSS